MTPAPRRPEVSRDAFVQTLVRSRVLDRGRIETALAQLSKNVSARQLADNLIDNGDITHYQAEKLLQGLSNGLSLGPYIVLAPLGKGGMGTVYLARDTRMSVDGPNNGIVALKVLPAKRAREEERTLHRFRREMELGRHVIHENITCTLDAGEVNGIHYIAMEYVPGHTLRQLVAKDGPLPIASAARVFSDVAAGLAHAHNAGLIHRDLKPSNIMVTPEGRGKILDFGLAILMDEALPADPSIVGGQGYILGTMDYIAPEQAVNSTNVSPQSDLYALGCSMYFALTGAPPFPGGSSKQKINWHKREDPPPVNMLNSSVPIEVAKLVERMMAKRSDDRPADAETVRALLARWVGDKAAGQVNAAHTARELLAEVDTRAIDPNLWDATPFITLTADSDASPEPNEKPVKRRRKQPLSLDDDEEEGRPLQTLLLWIFLGVMIGLVSITILFLMLRRL